MPSGPLRVSCPIALASSVVGPVAIEFMVRYSDVRVSISTNDGRGQPFSEPADLAIVPSSKPLRDSSLVARRLVNVHYVMVAAPHLQHGIPALPGLADFPPFPAIGWTALPETARWLLRHREHGQQMVTVDVRFTTDNLLLVREAALGGVGVAQMPYAMCREDINRGNLCVVAPDWLPPQMGIYVLYPSRRSLTLAGRKFIEVLEEGLSSLDRGAI